MVSNFKMYLKKAGIKEGQKVLILVPMSIDLYVTLLAVWSIGAIPSFMDAGFIKNNLSKNDFNDIDALIGITKYMLYSNINANLKKLKTKINVNKIYRFDLKKELRIEEVNGDFPAIITYTSGTTGQSKIAARSHEFLGYQGEILEKTLNYEDSDIEISTIPIFTLSNINAGITTVIADANFSNLGKSNPKKLVNQMVENGINRIMAAPGLLHIITKYCTQNKIGFKYVKKIYTGGGAVFLDFVQKLKQAFPYSNITTLYGSTEAEPIAELDIEQMTAYDIEKTKNGYGILAGDIVGVESCKIIKTGIQEIGELTWEEFEGIQTDIGEIVVAGKNVLKGYVNGIGDKENKFLVQGEIYHRTGDLGSFDESGKLWLRGRIKEPFFNIEAALHAKFDIDKTAVFEFGSKIILVLENPKDNYVKLPSEEEIRKVITFANIDEIRYIDKIPVDKRHSTKVDYNELKKILDSYNLNGNKVDRKEVIKVNFLKKWYIYQKERFPLISFIPMMVMFGFCGLSYSLHLNNPNAKLSDVGVAPYVVAVISTLIWFMLLRIADEHKDFEEDSKFRPYRPVQRGIVTLKELRNLGIILGLIQCVMAIWIDWKLLIVLSVVYFWFFLMCKEFFVPKWLKAHPTWYLASHMIILPFIDLYATSLEWVPRGGFVSVGLIVFMISTLCDGTVVEVGRKLRAPENEEYGVDTYTHIWGTKKAMVVWMLCVSISYCTTLAEGFFVNVGYELGTIITILYIIAWRIAMKFYRDPSAKNAKPFIWFPAIWEFIQYFVIGVIPFLK